jgi:hypothetical protein
MVVVHRRKLFVDTYRVYFEIPVLARLVEIDDDFLVWQAKLFQGDLCPLSPGAAMIGVEHYIGRIIAGGDHGSEYSGTRYLRKKYVYFGIFRDLIRRTEGLGLVFLDVRQHCSKYLGAYKSICKRLAYSDVAKQGTTV